MAIARMRKIQILIHRDERERFVERLHELGQLHITDVRSSTTAEHHADLALREETSDEDLENRLSRIQFALDFLQNLEVKRGFLSGLVPAKVVLTPEQFRKTIDEYDEAATVSECRSLERERTELLSAVVKMEAAVEQLGPWLALDCPLEDIGSTEHVAVLVGTLPVETFPEFQSALGEKEPDTAVERVHQDQETVYILLWLHQDIFPECRDLLKRFGFEEAAFPEGQDTPEALCRQTRGKIQEAFQRIQEIEARGRQYLKERQNLQVRHDYLADQIQQRRIEANFGRTEKVTVIEGWVPADSLEPFEAVLSEGFETFAILSVKAGDQEEPPVVLRNSETFVRPFEVVTELYGLPNTKEYDPSPLLAPFFFIFFGLCITDAAYGIIIALMFVVLMRKFRITLGRTKLVQLLLYGGVSTILMGALTGGWFGDLSAYLPPWLDGLARVRTSLMLFEPMEQVLVFMGIVLVLGFTQICYGLIIRLVREVRRGDLLEAFFGPFPWLTLLNGLVMFGLSRAGLFSSHVAAAGKWMALFSAVAIVLFTDRTSRSWFARIAWGIYGLYGITSYVGDVLSYLRLFALGLATGIIAMVVNLLADMLGGVPYIGWGLFVIVFIVGHIFNILINGLGAFVHTLRLQYVEFFPKFFQGGGRPYRPFQRKARYTIVTEE